jgi:hypothetical protein
VVLTAKTEFDRDDDLRKLDPDDAWYRTVPYIRVPDFVRAWFGMRRGWGLVAFPCRFHVIQKALSDSD